MSTFNSTVRTRRKTRLATALALALGVVASQALAADAVPSLTTEAVMAIDRDAAHSLDGFDPASILIRGSLSGDADPTLAQVLQRLDHAQPRQTTGNIFTVTSCADSGTGSLREAFNAAQSGDTIDISHLTCGAIKLTSSVVTTVDNLTIVGDPERKYGINGQNSVRPIVHTGTGTLTLDGVVVMNGRFSSATEPSLGGCVYSMGNAHLVNQTRVKYCSAINTNPANVVEAAAKGGGVFAKDTLVMTDSLVAMGTVQSNWGKSFGGNIYADKVIIATGTISGGTAIGGIINRGGGIYAKSGFMGQYVSIDGNEATGGIIAKGGGLWVGSGEDIQLKYSTVYDNTSSGAAGLAIGGYANDGDSLTIQSSTIANNKSIVSGNQYGGAIYAGTDTVTINNTTISGNIESNASNKKYGAGLRIKPGVTATLSSTVVGGNMLKRTDSSTAPDDLTAADFSGSETVNGTIVGGHNFISARLNTHVPADTLGLGAGFIPLDPMLEPLADNGGYTKTMLPKPGSPLINAGYDNGLTKDQRGSEFPRVTGLAADIGAVETDIIFANGFD